MCVWGGVCGEGGCGGALRIVFRDKILCFKVLLLLFIYQINKLLKWLAVQRTMLDSEYNEHIPGNTDKTGLVKRNLAYPVLTSKIQIYPKEFNSYIAMTARLYGYKAREYS